MRRFVVLALWVVLLAGCQRSERTVVMRSDAAEPAPGNLVFGPSVDDSRIAALIPPRSDWPYVDNGYTTDDVTFYARALYDVQMQYDRHGSLYYEQQSIQTGVRVR